MSFVSTAVSLIGKVGSALGKLATPALAGATIYSALRPGSPGSYGFAPTSGALALPGGAPTMAGYGLPLALGAGALTGLLGTTPGSPYGGWGEPAAPMFAPTAVRGGYRMPHTVHVAHPSGNGSMVVYVKAPPVRYRVSVRGYKRRSCSGG